MISVKTLKSTDDFKSFVNENDGKLRICRLMAPWCGPCRVLGETIRGLDPNKIGDTLFAEIDIDTDETEQVGVDCNVRGVPVMIFYKNGEEVKRIMGAVPAVDIYKAIEELS